MQTQKFPADRTLTIPLKRTHPIAITDEQLQLLLNGHVYVIGQTRYVYYLDCWWEVETYTNYAGAKLFPCNNRDLNRNPEANYITYADAYKMAKRLALDFVSKADISLHDADDEDVEKMFDRFITTGKISYNEQKQAAQETEPQGAQGTTEGKGN